MGNSHDNFTNWKYFNLFYIAVEALVYRTYINEYFDKYTYVVQEFSRRDKYVEANNYSAMPGRH
jgi:hypothetical protein